MAYHIWIGYDPSEHEAYSVAKHTLEKHSYADIEVHPIEHMELRRQGLFTREWEIKPDGQTICKVDNRPFSTAFSHSRFLVPELWRNLSDPDKESLAMFVDCDWLFLGDIGEVFNAIESDRILNADESPVYCVQHDYNPNVEKKMHGVKQSKYNMKLWSALMVFNMRHNDCKTLTADIVNTWDGRALHQFEWIQDTHKIGRIPEEWNFIPGHSENRCDSVKGLHYTLGGPWFKGYEQCKYADLWNNAYNDYLMSKIKGIKFDTDSILKGE